MIDQHKTLTEKFIKKGFWLYLFSFIIAPIWYIIKIVVSGDISVSELWILYGVLSLVILFSSFNDFWMNESLNYFIPKYVETKDYDKVKSLITYSIIVQIITGIIIAIILFFGSYYLAENYFKSTVAINILKIFAIYFLWVNIFQTFNNFFLAVQNTFYNKITEFLRMIFILIFSLFIFFSEFWNVVNYSSAWVFWLYFWIVFVVLFFYKAYYKKYLFKAKILWSKKLFKKIFSYAIFVFIWAQAATLLSQVDMQMVIYLLWTKQAWYYTNYLSIIWIPFMIIWPIFWLLFPMFSQMHAKKDLTKICLVKKILSKNFIAVAIAFNIFMFVFAEAIAYTLFWQKYLISGVIMQYSILFLVFNFLLQINFNILAWIWQIKDRVKIILIALVFNFIMNIILIKLIWVYWAALATWFGWVLIYVLSEYYLGKKYFVKLEYTFLTKNIILLWLLWTFCYYFINPSLISLGRITNLWIMTLLWIMWFGVFGLINFREFKSFVLEVKKLKE